MKIVLIEERGGQPQRPERVFEHPTVKVGRDPAECHVVFNQSEWPMVSRRHAEFRFKNGRCLLVDTNSSFGTFLNGRRITEPTEVQAGARAQFGAGGPVMLVARIEQAAPTPQANLAEMETRRDMLGQQPEEVTAPRDAAERPQAPPLPYGQPPQPASPPFAPQQPPPQQPYMQPPPQRPQQPPPPPQMPGAPQPAQPPYAQPPQGQPPYGQPPFGQPPFGQPPYAPPQQQQPGQPPYAPQPPVQQPFTPPGAPPQPQRPAQPPMPPAQPPPMQPHAAQPPFAQQQAAQPPSRPPSPPTPPQPVASAPPSRPAAPAEPAIIEIKRSATGNLERIKLTKDVSRLGREPGMEVTIEAAAAVVSRRHAEIQKRDGQYTLVDLGSFNGTLLNDQRITSPTPLYDGDQIQLGMGGPILRFVDPAHPAPAGAQNTGQRSVAISSSGASEVASIKS